MRCDHCGQENGDGSRFCSQCGAQLVVVPGHATELPAMLGEGRYRIVSQIGDGLRKAVYRAHDTLLEREVAVALVKTDGLDDAERTRVEREIRMFARLGSHPNIVTLYDVDDFDGSAAMVFEFVPGGTVWDLLQSTGGRGLPIRDVVRIGEQMARALDAVHREDILFRDLKPANVLLAGEGTAKLCDFGLALMPTALRVTDPELVMGSLHYIAPERVARRHSDHRSDLYSLGVLLYEMLTGTVPFPGDDIQEIGAQHLHADPPPVLEARPNTPPELADLVHRLLAKGVADRPQAAAHVAAELARIHDQL